MKTKKAKCFENFKVIRRLNFLKNVLVIFSILTLIGINSKVQAQMLYIDADNTASSGCDWEVKFYDASSNLITSFVLVAGMGPTIICQNFLAIVDHIVVDDMVIFCSVNFIVSPGSNNYNAYTPPCAGLTCSSNIDCQEGTTGPSGCSTAMYTYVIRIN